MNTEIIADCVFLNSKKLMVKKWSKPLYRNGDINYLNNPESTQGSNCPHVSKETDKGVTTEVCRTIQFVS
jgi:hypothetical protein